MGNPRSRHVVTWNDGWTVRSEEEIAAAEEELTDRVWYDSHEMLVAEAAEMGLCPDCAGLADEAEAARELEEKYGLEQLTPYCCQYCSGVLSGKLAALRWVLGEEWDC